MVAGGQGKTPTALSLGAELKARGKSIHFLSRGYGGSLEGPVKVDPDTHSAQEVGDEPLLLTEIAPAWISTDRQAGIEAAHQAGADIIVMDDGGFGAERRIFEKNGDPTGTADYVTPDLATIAQAYGIAGYKVTSGAEMETVLADHDFKKEAALVHVVFDYELEPTEMVHAGWA